MSPFKVPSSYRNCSGCHNCSKVFKMFEYDDDDTYFCTNGSEKRPLSGSVFMKEEFDMFDNDKYTKQNELWNDWSEGRQVASYGICDEWTKDSDPSCNS